MTVPSTVTQGPGPLQPTMLSSFGVLVAPLLLLSASIVASPTSTSSLSDHHLSERSLCQINADALNLDPLDLGVTPFTVTARQADGTQSPEELKLKLQKNSYDGYNVQLNSTLSNRFRIHPFFRQLTIPTQGPCDFGGFPRSGYYSIFCGLKKEQTASSKVAGVKWATKWTCPFEGLTVPIMEL